MKGQTTSATLMASAVSGVRRLATRSACSVVGRAFRDGGLGTAMLKQDNWDLGQALVQPRRKTEEPWSAARAASGGGMSPMGNSEIGKSIVQAMALAPSSGCAGARRRHSRETRDDANDAGRTAGASAASSAAQGTAYQ